MLKQAAIPGELSAETFTKGQLRRRRAALDAASALLSEFGEQGVTMRAIAGLADMSPGTPYNLFGSKQGILEAIFAEDMERYLIFFREHAPEDALGRIFYLATSSMIYCEDRPIFYLALFRSLIRNADSEWGALAWAARKLFISSLIDDAVATGALRNHATAPLLATTIFRLHKALCQEWVDGALDLRGAGDAMGATLALILTPFVTPQFTVSFEQLCSRYL